MEFVFLLQNEVPVDPTGTDDDDSESETPSSTLALVIRAFFSLDSDSPGSFELISDSVKSIAGRRADSEAPRAGHGGPGSLSCKWRAGAEFPPGSDSAGRARRRHAGDASGYLIQLGRPGSTPAARPAGRGPQPALLGLLQDPGLH